MKFPEAIGFDVETVGDKPGYGLQPFKALSGQGRISAASFARGEVVEGLLDPAASTLSSVIGAAADQDVYLVGWNVSFDASWCIAVGAEEAVMRAKWLDAMLLWRHWCVEPEGDDVPKKKRKSYALKAALLEFFPENADFKEFDDFEATDQASLELLLERNKGDALFTLKLAELFWSKLNNRQQFAALVEAQCIPLVAKTKVMGINSSKERAQELSRMLEIQAVDIYQMLLETSPEIKGLNLGSNPQLQKLLFETWGLPVQGVSRKTKLPSTDKFALFDLAVLDPRAKMIKELREAKNNRTKYAEATLKSLEYNGDGCVRPAAKIFGTYTSRMTYASQDKVKAQVEKTTKAKGLHLIEKNVMIPTGVALHQWKRGREYRDLIRAPEGYVLTEFDFSGQEFRWMAVASEDETMLELCAPGEDAHSFMGAQIAEVDYRDLIRRVHAGDAGAANERKAGKFGNLSYQYRVSPKTATKKARVEYGLEVDLPFIQRTQTIYKQSYTGVPVYWKAQIQKCKLARYAETFAGRRVQLPGRWFGKDAWGNESTAINYPIQGTGGDQKYLALAVARNHLNKFGGIFYYELHDGLFFIFPEATVDAAIPFFRNLLSALPYKQAWGVDLPIAFPVDSKKGPSWGELVEVE